MIVAAGFVSGVLAGFFGIGGGLLLTPFIRIVLNRPESIALGTTLPVIIPSAIAGLIARRKRGYLVRDAFMFSSMGVVLGTTAGALLTAYIDLKLLMIATSFLIIGMSARLLSGRSKSRMKFLEKFKTAHRRPVLFFVGVSAGLLSGLLGLGGGLFLVPGLLVLSGLNAHEATATSLAVVLVAAVLGSVLHSELRHIDWLLAFYLGASSLAGAYLGSKLSLKADSALLEKMFGTFLAAVGVWFLFFELLN